ncbi:hypothetical protein EVAR_22199_1 [Eumeta japonica]|uniref:Uncharacterized protein n=1 Tax=Eumeta variegata TaxID=151549 RepID=A0A4C1UAD5_EUMVA|nr:hypothetical protein EVAR_22199_1 [Eumeta japonica]
MDAAAYVIVAGVLLYARGFARVDQTHPFIFCIDQSCWRFRPRSHFDSGPGAIPDLDLGPLFVSNSDMDSPFCRSSRFRFQCRYRSLFGFL